MNLFDDNSYACVTKYCLFDTPFNNLVWLILEVKVSELISYYFYSSYKLLFNVLIIYEILNDYR